MRAPLGLLAAVLSLAVHAQDNDPGVPPEQLRFISDIVGTIKTEYAGPLDDARLAGACATSVRDAAKATSLQAAAGLTAIPQLLAEAKRAAPADVTYEQLSVACVKGMVATLDKHSAFLDQPEFRELLQASPGGGGAAIGLELGKRGDAIVVVEPIEGAPAHRAGMQAGDHIISVDTELLDGKSLEAASRMLRGRSGSDVRVVVERSGVAERLHFAMQREIIRPPRPKVEWLQGDILYMKFTRMLESTRDDLVRAIDWVVQGREPAGLILDLRDNTGGLLRTTAEVAGLFLASDALVGTMKGKRSEEFRAGRTTSRRDYADARLSPALSAMLQRTPMAVLVNAKTSSGGEIVAAALQGHGRARLVGTPTLGMGSIQTIMPLGNNRALKLTTYYWMAPGERMLEGNPLQPDVKVASDDALAVREAAVRHLNAKGGG